MNIRYDADADVLVVVLRSDPLMDAIDEPGGVIVSYGERGEHVSVEFLNASIRQLIAPGEVSVPIYPATDYPPVLSSYALLPDDRRYRENALDLGGVPCTSGGPEEIRRVASGFSLFHAKGATMTRKATAAEVGSCIMDRRRLAVDHMRCHNEDRRHQASRFSFSIQLQMVEERADRRGGHFRPGER
jgi:uncharacterized protein YuzE